MDPRLPSGLPTGAVWELDLKQAGLDANLPGHASAVSPNDERIELFVDGARMWPARYPNDDPANRTRSYARIGGHSGPNETVVGWGDDMKDRPASWVHTPLDEINLNGYFHIGWADDVTALKAIDTQNRTFTFEKPLHYWPVTSGQWYFALNLIEELDAPGEWWFDRNQSKLFLYPPAQ